LQSRQKHSILSLLNLIMKTSKASGNQAMVRKMTAPGFIFVRAGTIRPFAPGYGASGALNKAAK
jgi:hypothetical protein